MLNSVNFFNCCKPPNNEPRAQNNNVSNLNLYGAIPIDDPDNNEEEQLDLRSIMNQHGLRYTRGLDATDQELIDKTLKICYKHNEMKQLTTKIKRARSGLFANNEHTGVYHGCKMIALISLMTFAGMNLYSLSKNKSYSSGSTIALACFLLSLIIVYYTSMSRVTISIKGLNDALCQLKCEIFL